MRRKHYYSLLAGIFFLFLLFPQFTDRAEANPGDILLALAGFTFECAGPVPIGDFYPGFITCPAPGPDTIFSYAVCTYEDILSEVLGNLYCGMQFTLIPPLTALLTLFVVFVGAGFMLGIIPFTPRETVLALFKFGLVWVFATEADFTVELLYLGLLGFIAEATGAILTLIDATAAAQAAASGVFSFFGINLSLTNGVAIVFSAMDAIVAEFIGAFAGDPNSDEPCENGVATMFLSFAAVVPILAVLGVGIVIQFFFIFIQLVFGYFIAITGITFLIAVAPIFISMALFKYTRNYFDQWLSYLLSFAVQIFVVFGFIGIILSLDLGEDLRSMFELSQPYDSAQQYGEGARTPVEDWCTICTPQAEGDFGISCADEEPVDVLALLTDPDVVDVMSDRLIKIMVLAWVLHKLMLTIPGLAKALGNVAYAPAVGGSDVFSQGAVSDILVQDWVVILAVISRQEELPRQIEVRQVFKTLMG